MNFKKLLSICKRSKAYFLYDLPDGEQMLSNGSCGYILYGHPLNTRRRRCAWSLTWQRMTA